MSIDLYTDEAAWDALRDDWHALLQRSASPVLFLTWEWQRAWWASFGKGKELCLLAKRGSDGGLVGVAPLFMQDTLLDAHADLPGIRVEKPALVGDRLRTVHIVGGTEVSDYLDVLSPKEHYADLWADVFQFLARLDNWQILDLHSIPAGSPTLPVVEGLARSLGWRVNCVREDVCPVVELPATWEEYLSNRLSKKQRHELRRKMRKAEQEAAVAWQWAHEPGTLDAGLETFFSLHRASHPEKNAFMDETMERYFRAIASATARRDWLRLGLLTYDGQPVASYLCFDFGADRLVYNSGFDLSSHGSLAPGIVLMGHLISDAIQRGLQRVDFLQGDERYKYEFGAVDTEVMRLLIRR